MKKNHFLRIFITYILIVFAGSVLIGFFSIELFKYSFVNAAQGRMSSNINLIRSSINEQLKNDAVDYDYLAKKYSEDIGSTVTFIDLQGMVMGEKIKGFSKGKDFLKDSEIIEAKQNGTGYNFFYNHEVNTYILNIAKYVKSENFNGFIHLSTPLYEFKNVNKGIISYTYIGVIFVLFSSGILRLLFQKDIIAPLNRIIDNSQKTSIKDMESRIGVKSDDIIGRVIEEHNLMLDRLKEGINQILSRSYRVRAGLNDVDIGVVIIDTEERIIYTNPYILRMFNSKYDSDQIENHKIIELITDSKINNLIKQTLGKGECEELETTLDTNDSKTVKVLINPIEHELNNNCNSKLSNGLLAITIYDITQIKKLEQMGSDFVSNSTHELKTPLTSIKGFVETLRSGAVEDKEVAYRFLEIIDLECDRLYSLINDILQLSEIQNLKQDVNLELNYIQDIVQEVAAFLDGQAVKKNIKLHVDVQNGIPLVFINKNRIRQMLINIVDNAIKYTQVGGNVNVKVLIEEKHVLISVIDNGIGIPESSLSRLFERFYRVDKGRSRSQGGTGLGLSIVKHIVDLYNGTIDIKSEVGKGTEFTVRLPLSLV